MTLPTIVANVTARLEDASKPWKYLLIAIFSLPAGVVLCRGNNCMEQ